MNCERCGRETKYTKVCRFCAIKETKSKYPKEVESNKECSFGCKQYARYQFKNGSFCCSKGQQYCPEVRRKNSEASKGKPSGMLGKKHSKESKKLMSINNKGGGWNRGLTKETDERVRLASEKMKKSPLTENELRKIKEIKLQHKKELKNKKSLMMKERWKDPNYRKRTIFKGDKNGNYKGLHGKWCCYNTTKNNLQPIEQVKRDLKNKNILNVRCHYCNKWYRPSAVSVMNRTMGLNTGTCYFYCSEDCKELCSDYGQIKYPKGYKNQHQNEVSPELRKVVFKRDNWICQKCHSAEKLECHHIDPVSQEPFFANDPDSCITLCKKCHKFIHMKIEGCKYHELRIRI